MKIEVSAKTIEKAIEDGLKQLNTTIENVDVKVLSEGGMFKKAKIEMTLTNETEKAVKAEAPAEITEETIKVEKSEEVSKPVPKKLEPEVVVENFPQEETKDVKVVLEELTKVTENLPEVSDEEKQQRKQELINQTMELAKAWLDGLVYTYNINATVELEPRENDVYANIVGENLGVLIGYHGEAMEAIQHLLNTHLYNKLKGAKRVFIDVSGYRAKRTNDLKELAHKIAGRVLENKRSYKLDPMNSFERRIIHEELSQTKNILTHSEGEEPNRYLVIEYTEE
ncbi:MAG: KH domain-containing protein [Clostridia bacterium]|nr:KH domain-containing protein [Clostridia bacterium]